MPEKPTATAEQRPVTYITNPLPPGTRMKRMDKVVREPVPDKFETIRHGVCPDHSKPSTDFVGVTEDGWLFHCKGYNQRGQYEPDLRHYFHNNPAP